MRELAENGARAAKRVRSSRSEKVNLEERRVSTPRPDLAVVKIGRPNSRPAVPAEEMASTLVASLAKAIRMPRTSRKTIFHSSVGKQVFVYSVYPRDTSKIIREDVHGKKTLGRLVNGRFRALSASQR